jgi:acyl-CoA dehydrogenase
MVRIAHIRHRLETVAAYLGGMLDEVIAYRALGRSLGAAAVQIHLNTLKVLAAEQTFAAVNEMIALTGLEVGYLADSPVPLERLFRDLRSASLNYNDTRLLTANGKLSFLDPTVTLLGQIHPTVEPGDDTDDAVD